MKLKAISNAARRWLFYTPHRALERAYQAALAIARIETEHFNGQKISAEFAKYSPSIIAYFQTELQKYLRIIKVRLAEFRVSHSILSIREIIAEQPGAESGVYSLTPYQASVLDKLNFIDAILNKYRPSEKRFDRDDIVDKNSEPVKETRDATPKSNISGEKTNNSAPDNMLDQMGVLPRTFWRTINKIKQDINPQVKQTEEDILKRYRQSRNKTIISLKFISVLIIVPLLSHQLSKNFLIEPLVDRYFETSDRLMFINTDIEEEAYEKLHRFEEKLNFRSLTGLTPNLSSEQKERQIELKAREIMTDSLERTKEGISNIFADVFSLLAFAAIVAFRKREIIIFKSFLDNLIYGLSDSAKAFSIILLTDIFVGYHSPHGWEIILESVSRHFGLPENREFNFLFIATFPVILDTVMKYWIFRYLNRISPSAVATYRNMNE